MFTPLAADVQTPHAEDSLSACLKSSIEMALYVLASAPDTLEGLTRAKSSVAFILGEAWREADCGQIALH